MLTFSRYSGLMIKSEIIAVVVKRNVICRIKSCAAWRRVFGRVGRNVGNCFTKDAAGELECVVAPPREPQISKFRLCTRKSELC